jgi:hypothetical protein
MYKILGLVVVSLLIIGFQNCGGDGFKAIVLKPDSNDQGSNSSSEEEDEIIFLGPAAPELRAPFGIALSSQEKFAYIIDSTLKALIAVNLETGEKNIVSDANVGTGPLFGSTRGITIHHESKTAFITNTLLGGSYIIKVDLTNGNRAIVSNFEVGIGPFMTAIYDVIVNPLGTELFSSDINDGAIYKINIESGDRSYLKPAVLGQNASIIYSLFANSTFTQAFAVNGRTDSIFKIDLVTGAIVVISNSTIGAGPVFGTPWAIVLNNNDTSAYVTDSILTALFKVDLSTGDRTIISDSTTGLGAAFADPVDLAINSQETTAFIVDASRPFGKLIRVDLATGDRQAIE